MQMIALKTFVFRKICYSLITASVVNIKYVLEKAEGFLRIIFVKRVVHASIFTLNFISCAFATFFFSRITKM